jgi:ferritin-like metal-binding protein YciE
MGQLKDPRELFVHELKDIYYVEKKLTDVLPKMAAETTDRELASGFKTHLRETEKQVGNLEKVFGKLGRPAQGEQCPGFDGIKREHDEFMQENPGEQVLNVFLTGAAARTEHYEIAAYTGLIAQARALGEREVVELLDENLKQEKETLRKVEKIGRRLTKEATNGGRTRAKASSSRRASARRRQPARAAR